MFPAALAMYSDPHQLKTPHSRITVLLVEDHFLVREGLRALLMLGNEFEIVGEASDGRQAVSLAVKLRPAVVIMDIALPLLNGLEATRKIVRAVPATRVLILSAYSDDLYVERAIAAGAAGYLVKQSDTRAFTKAIREIHKGNLLFSRGVASRRDRLRQKAQDQGEPDPGPNAACLSSREVEVLQLIAEGKANKQSADVLRISIKTVEKHRQNVMEKLHIHDTAGLTRYAIAAGIIESSTQDTTL
jgi:DNA-binding NarL/FixJ family response regulator